MTWRWSHEQGRFVLRPVPLPPILADAGFLGRGDPRSPAIRGPVAALRQVHGAVVHRVAAPVPSAEGDALVTVEPGLILTVRTADCVPLLLVHRSRGIALVHAGWRGLAAGVVEAAATVLGDAGDADAFIGPTIGPCCYEVGPEVATALPQAVTRPPARGVKSRLDLAAEARRRLAAAGTDPARVHAARCCTRCHQHLLYSHRGSGGAPGRIVAFAALAARPQEA